jgi:hypothetical protein
MQGAVGQNGNLVRDAFPTVGGNYTPTCPENGAGVFVAKLIT